jgi:hypothetical protein
MGKLENLLSFNDFDKSWKPSVSKSTKRTETGVDVLNENLYMKVMDQEASGWKSNLDKFIKSIVKSINENQAKEITITPSSATFTIRGRKHRVNKNDGSMTLWRLKATEYRDTTTDSAGRVREEKKKKKTSENIEVTIPISKAEGTMIYNALKERED